MKNKNLQMKRALHAALLLLLLSAAGATNGYAQIHDTIGNTLRFESLSLPKGLEGFHDTIGDIEYYFASPNPAAPYKYPYNAAIVMGHKDGTAATGPLIIPDSVHWLGNENSILVPVARIHLSAFEGCSGLTSITFPNTVEEILDGAFKDCSGLTGDLIIPNSVKTIGPRYYYPDGFWPSFTGAFEGCGFTGALVISNSVDSIGYDAFRDCSFSSVTCLATIPPYLGWNGDYYGVFAGVPCTTLVVPCGCRPIYQASDWHYFFTTIIEDCNGLLEDEDNLFSVSPNPASDIVHFEAEGLRRVSICNMLGQIIFNGNTSGNAFEYDFGQHGDGVYLVRIETTEGVATRRVVVKK